MDMHPTYIVFAYDDYYPRGGSDDIQLITTGLKEALLKAEELANGHDFDTISVEEIYVNHKIEMYCRYKGRNGVHYTRKTERHAKKGEQNAT